MAGAGLDHGADVMHMAPGCVPLPPPPLLTGAGTLRKTDGK